MVGVVRVVMVEVVVDGGNHYGNRVSATVLVVS